MASRNRETLRRYFGKGKMPTEESFTDLIDSMHNIIDDGRMDMSRTDELDIAPNAEGKTIGIYKFRDDIGHRAPNWTINFDKESDDLSISSEYGKDVIRMDKDGKVGINNAKPETTLDVTGTISSSGRAGNFVQATVPADGQWHTVIEGLNGCYLFEVVAGTRGSQKSGRFALLHAIAASTYNSRNKIRKTQAHYGSYFHRICLRWHGTQDHFSLQVKTRINYGMKSSIQVQLSNLWHQPDMLNCLKENANK